MVPLRTGRVFCAVAWAVSEGSDRLVILLGSLIMVVRTVRVKINYYVLCNERYRMERPAKVQVDCLLVYIHMLQCCTAAMQSIAVNAKRKIIEGQVDSAFVPEPRYLQHPLLSVMPRLQ